VSFTRSNTTVIQVLSNDPINKTSQVKLEKNSAEHQTYEILWKKHFTKTCKKNLHETELLTDEKLGEFFKSGEFRAWHFVISNN